MRVVILGSGAMGCLYGAAWHRSGCDVRLVDVSQPHIDAINANGLKLDLRSGVEILNIPACRPEELTGQADLVVVFTKTFQTQQALEGIKQAIGNAIGSGTYLLSLQNGLGNDERLAKFVPIERVMVGVCTLPADLAGPGSVRSHGDGGSKIYPAFTPVTKEAVGFVGTVANNLTQGGIPTSADSDIQAAVWSKAIFNAVMNPLCALTLRTPGFLGANTESRSMITKAVEEGVAAAHASGVMLDAKPIHDLTEISMTDHADHEASMLQDIKAGRRTEVDAITGAIVRAAKAKAIATPVLETLHALVKLEEAKLAEV